MMVETWLLRGKRSAEKCMEIPWLRQTVKFALFAGGGMVLSGVRIFGQMQPVAAGLIAGAPGVYSLPAAFGSAMGYRLFWGRSGSLGVIWAAGMLILGWLSVFLEPNRQLRTAGSAACLMAVSLLVYSFRMEEPASLLRLGSCCALGAACVYWAQPLLKGRGDNIRWLRTGLGVMALSNIRSPVWVNPGYALAGAVAAASPLPGAVAVGLGAELGRPASVSITAVAALSWLMQQVPAPEMLRRVAAPACACLFLMIAQDRPDWQLLIPIGIGGALGGILPWRLTPAPKQGRVGAAQVQLEQTARVLGFFQRQLLEYSPPPLDGTLLLNQVRRTNCDACTSRRDCREKDSLSEEYLEGGGEFPCRKSAQLSASLHQARDQMKRMKLARAQQQEYRTALIQQYGFLADALRRLSDRLPRQDGHRQIRYRVQVSSRSRGKERAEGDRVLAFPGAGRYYVLLCDGMGTGLGAQEEGRQAAELLREMLTAGMPPASALGGLNSQLTLLGRAGAVTVDLAEIRLDSGCTWLYKWGASPSWVLNRGRARQIGHSTAPPGLDLERHRETVGRVLLDSREVLVMTSDGVSPAKADGWAVRCGSMETGELAEAILAEDGSWEDDATVVVIRLAQTREEKAGVS